MSIHTEPSIGRELFVLWPAWLCLVEYVSRTAPTEADPRSVYGSLLAADRDRLVARLFGHGVAGSLAGAANALDEVMWMAQQGRRPRYGRELGLDPEEFGCSG